MRHTTKMWRKGGTVFRFLSRFDWRKSKAHWHLLTQFLRDRSVSELSRDERWEAALREPLPKAVDRLADEGLLARADLAAHLTYELKTDQLKRLLRDRGLPVSGRKAQLAARLAEADRAAMRKLIGGLVLLRCTEAGAKLAQEYLEQERAERAVLERNVTAALRAKRYEQACLMVARFEAEQVRPRGIGVDWADYDASQDVQYLEDVFGTKPKVLAGAPDADIAIHRMAVALGHILGEGAAHWLPPGAPGAGGYSALAVANLLITHAAYRRGMAALRGIRDFARKVSARTCNDDLVCDACRKLAERQYPLSRAPELPYQKCTSEGGCRCWIGMAECS